MGRKWFLGLILAACSAVSFSSAVFSKTETQTPAAQLENRLFSVECEILEVNELKEPPGSAIYKVKVFDTGETMDLFADRDRTLIVAGTEVKKAPDVLGGTKATLIYGDAKEQDLPVIVFAKVVSTATA